jgi:trans-aconitate methyltransferase
MTEWNASAYYGVSRLQQVLAEEQLALLTLTGTERVLDIGCGDGKITAEVAVRLPRGSVLGVDPSHDMIAFASSHFSTPAHPNLRFAVGDARSLPYRDEFDLVISFNALHWVLEQEAALRSIRAALKPGGKAVLRFVPAGPRQCLEDVTEETSRSPRWAGYFQGHPKPYAHFTPEEYRTLAERAGLRVLALRVKDGAWDFQTRDAFLAFCRATCIEWNRRLPESEWTAFLTDVLDRYQAVAAEKPGEVNTFKFYQMELELVPQPGSGP